MKKDEYLIRFSIHERSQKDILLKIIYSKAFMLFNEKEIFMVMKLAINHEVAPKY